MLWLPAVERLRFEVWGLGSGYKVLRLLGRRF